jgi:SAM-dependent methyltransferase
MLVRDAQWWSRQKLIDISSVSTSQSAVWLQEAFQNSFRRLVVQRIEEFLTATRKGRPVGKVVDLACGPGDWTLAYLAFAERVVGVDVCSDFIEAARRTARSTNDPERAEFSCHNVIDYQEFEDADLVCLGACLQCISDDDFERILENLDHSLQPGACVYVRTSVAVGEAYQSGGFYRRPEEYERRFSVCRLRVADRFPSSAVLPSQLIRDLLGIRSFKAGRMLAAPVWLGHRAYRHLATKCEHQNWFLVRH